MLHHGESSGWALIGFSTLLLYPFFMTPFWAVARAANWVAEVYIIYMTVLDRMCFFCVHDETSHFVFVGEDGTKHIEQAVKRNNCKYQINDNNENNSKNVNNDNNVNNYNNGGCTDVTAVGELSRRGLSWEE